MEQRPAREAGSTPAGLDLDRADAYGQSFADVYDSWYQQVTDAEATAGFVAARCPASHRLVLEVGVGSGRLALPLARLGLTVVGVDGSASMLARLPDDHRRHGVHPVQADMRALPLRGRFGAALIAFNTLFNLADEAQQQQLLQRLAGLLDDDGVLVIEAIDASALATGPSDSIGVRSRMADGVVVSATQLDRDRQRLTGQHLEITDREVAVRPWRLRWLTADQLDALANEAGLALAERYGDWSGATFGPEHDTHISVYRRP